MTRPGTVAPASAPRAPASGAWLVWLTALACLPPFGLNLMVPLERAMVSDLAATPSVGLAAIGLYAVGLALGQPLAGVAADGWGRRPTLLTGLAVAAIGSAMACLAATAGVLLSGRLLAGIGLSVSLVVPRAALRDLADGALLQRSMSIISTAFAVMPAVTPVIGWWVLERSGWRSVLATLPLLTLAALLLSARLHRETRPLGTATPGWTSMAAIWRHPPARYVTLAFAAFGAIFFVLLGLVPTVVRDVLLADERFVALLMGGTFLGFLAGNVAVAYLSRRRSPLALCAAGCLLATLAVALMACCAARPSAVGWTLALLCYSLGHGMLFPSALTAVIQAMPDRAGIASAIAGMAPMLAGGCAAMAAYLIPLSPTGRLLVVCGLLVMTGSAAMRMAWRARQRQSHHSSGDPHEATG